MRVCFVILTALLYGCAVRQTAPAMPIYRGTPPASAPSVQTAKRECGECENPHYRPPGQLFMHLRGSGKPREYVGYHLFHDTACGFTLCPLFFEHETGADPNRGYFDGCVPLGKFTHYRKERTGQWSVLFQDDLDDRMVCELRITCPVVLKQDPESYAGCIALPKLCTPLITSPWPKLEDWQALPFDLF